MLSFTEAVEIYQKHLEATGAMPQQPSQSDSYLNRGVWYLRNVNGLMGRVGCKALKVF